MTMTNISKLQNLLSKLARSYEKLDQYEDQQRKHKVLDLYKKFINKEMTIGFSGHFSAGKSSMINEVIGDSILPASPIPTSANLVKIKNTQKPYTRVFFREEAPAHYESVLDMDIIHSLCRDGDAIKGIEIGKPISHLPEDVWILDTPGIDSSDEADRIITESSIHTVDVLFYVMDYNHVQSEVNLSFLKDLQKQEKPFYIIVNQIDKHEEEELSFTSFKDSVYQVLEQWGIRPEQLYFTSLHEENHSYNQLSVVKHLLEDLTHKKDSLMEETVQHALTSLLNSHVEEYKQAYQDELNVLEEQLEADEKLSELEQMQAEINEGKSLVEEAEIQLKKTMDDIFKNAYLMPYENREKARLFLESMQPGFKIGLFMTKKKTAEERDKRQYSFYEALMEVTAVQLETHIRDMAVNLAKKYQVTDEQILQDIQNFNLTYEPERLKKVMKTGAEVTGNYVLVYTNDVSNDLKNSAKEQIEHLWEKVNLHIEEYEKNIIKEKEEDLEKLKQHEQIREQINHIHRSIELRERELDHEEITDDLDIESSLQQMEKLLATFENNVQMAAASALESAGKTIKHEETFSSSEKQNTHFSPSSSVPVDDMIDRMEQSIHIIKDMKGFKTIAGDLSQKRDRLINRQFTVALFGAFSAGKSSFANALLGDNVLPVSPNPTTATINKIRPSDREHEHGTVRIQLKSEKQVLEDIIHAGKRIPDSFGTLEEAISWLAHEDLSEYISEGENKSLSFLHALQKGYHKLKNQLNQSLSIKLEDAHVYVAEEQYACFVESVEFYYDCPLTMNGVTLVDTPGADSINARHTEVAFEYIKDSDAILFVTYYNHAFSRADQEFLTQLGQVKDVFTLDKMFFVINAKDLAKNEEELELVQSYVKDNLTAFGIRQPRMFPVSSKWALQEKKENEVKGSGLMEFEKAFTSFIQDELTGIMVNSGFHDMKRAVSTLDEYRKRASMNAEEKQQRKDLYNNAWSAMLDLINQQSDLRYQQSIRQELEELIYYIHQRIFLNFSDLFKETFNPATIKSNGRRGKAELEMAFHQLIGLLEGKLIREVQATELRVEAFMKKQIEQLKEDVQNDDLLKDYQVTFQNEIAPDFISPKVDLHLDVIELEPFRKIFSSFKNTKVFFEQNEKEDTKQRLEETLKPLIKESLTDESHILVQNYLEQWEKEIDEVKQRWKETVNQYFEGLLYSLTDEVDITDLRDKYKQLENLVDV
ncbi:dynamin family protein [Salinibacillus aidingensis]|uniref:Dynamin family protein n=2 Tax=Salinibacillus aidingensis TaxID=237684 RepID=A0ABN1ANZ6_9BACI